MSNKPKETIEEVIKEFNSATSKNLGAFLALAVANAGEMGVEKFLEENVNLLREALTQTHNNALKLAVDKIKEEDEVFILSDEKSAKVEEGLQLFGKHFRSLWS